MGPGTLGTVSASLINFPYMGKSSTVFIFNIRIDNTCYTCYIYVERL